MNAVSAQHAVSSLTDGKYLRGRFIDAKVEKGKADKKGGNYPDRFVVSILSGDRTERVEYRDEKDALAALAPFSDSDSEFPPELADVLIAIGVRSAQSYTFYYGRRVSGD